MSAWGTGMPVGLRTAAAMGATGDTACATADRVGLLAVSGGISMLVFGVLLTLTVTGAIMGIPMIAAGAAVFTEGPRQPHPLGELFFRLSAPVLRVRAPRRQDQQSIRRHRSRPAYGTPRTFLVRNQAVLKRSPQGSRTFDACRNLVGVLDAIRA